MIQQPELGKKIAGYRKAKGLTQEELVEKCNLSVRTLQRIEGGEVTPRISTIKLIVEALELDFDNSLNSLYRSNRVVIKRWLRQFYINFIELFNLKTKTMKKISILSILIVAIVLGTFAINSRLSAQNNNTNDRDKKETENLSKSELPFFDFSCYGCTGKKGLVIGRDVSFKLNGVEVKNIRLMVVDKETREFDALFVEGKFLERKVIIDYPKEWLIDGNLKYTSDKIDKSNSKIVLKGNAKVYVLNDKDNTNDDELIKTEEIVINLK